MIRHLLLFTVLCFILTGQNCFAQTKSAVNITNTSIDSTGLLKWTAMYSGDSLLIQIEQLQGDKWRGISTMQKLAVIHTSLSKGMIFIDKDSTKVKLMKGLNKFRIEMTSPAKFISNEIDIVK